MTLRMVNGEPEDALERTAQVAGVNLQQISSFGTDNAGNLYVVSLTGAIYRLDPGIAAGDGADAIDAGPGNDSIFGGLGSDILNGGAGADDMHGGGGNDIFVVASAGDQTIELAGEGTDTVRAYIDWVLGNNVERLELQSSGNLNGTGNSLNNTLVGNAGNNILNGGAGNDYMVGGGGNDIFVVAAAGDGTIENACGGTDTVRSYINWTLANNVERLELRGSALNGTGNALENTIVGNSGANSLSVGGGDDYITAGGGNDTLLGASGGDRLVGGAGADSLFGGTGNDFFRYEALADSPVGPGNRDTIMDFAHGMDKISLYALDANTQTAGNQAFSFIGTAAFTEVAGQLSYRAFGNTCLVDADVNGDQVSDFQVAVAGTNFMTGTDFIL